MKRKKQLITFVIGSSILFGACQVNTSPVTGITQPATTGSAKPDTKEMTQPEMTQPEMTQPEMTQPAVTSSAPATEYPVGERLGVVNANLIGEALFARQGEWIFQAKESSEDGIIKSKLDGSEQSVVVRKSAKWLNLVGDWLYFVDYSSNGSIAKVKTDGTGYEILHDSMVTDMILRDDWIYFIDITKGRQIHKIKTDGTELTKMDYRKRASRLFLEGDWLYWSNFLNDNTISQDINTTKIDGSDGGLGLISEEMINVITVGEGNIFYHTTTEGRTNYVLRKLIADHSGSLDRFMSSKGITIIGVYQGWFYFYEGDQVENISRVRLDGSGREILVGPGNYGRVQFLGDKIIFYDNAFLNFGYWIMDLDGSNLRYFGK